PWRKTKLTLTALAKDCHRSWHVFSFFWYCQHSEQSGRPSRNRYDYGYKNTQVTKLVNSVRDAHYAFFAVAVTCQWLRLALFVLDSHGDDEIVCGRRAYVLEAVHHVGGGEDDSAWTDGLGLAVIDELEIAFADEKELGVAVLVRRMGHLAGGEGRLVDFDELASWQGAG